jgi:hypothetical protein
LDKALGLESQQEKLQVPLRVTAVRGRVPSYFSHAVVPPKWSAEISTGNDEEKKRNEKK